MALFALAALSTSVNQILKDTINAIGVLIAVYYGLSGFACAKYYAAANRTDKRLWWFRGAWPVASALFVFAVAAAQLATAGLRADALVIGVLLVGVLPLLYYRRHYGSRYYTQALEQAPAESY